MFVADPISPVFKVYPLKGSFKGYWSMNVDGDVRVLHVMDGDSTVIFGLIGTRSQLYG